MEEKTDPNILFLFPDQLRWDWLGCQELNFGKPPVRTPNIDALAGRGTRFTQCRTNSPLCAPARAALASGKRYHNLEVYDNGYMLDTDCDTVFKQLRSIGYRVATTGKNDLHKPIKFKGVDGWTQLLGKYGFTEAIDHSGKLDAQKNGKDEPNCSYTSYLHRHGLIKDYVEDYQRRQKQMSTPTADWPSPLPRQFYTDDVCGQNSIKMLQNFPVAGPWALWVNWPGPHSPFDPPRELQKRYDGVDFPAPVNGNEYIEKDGKKKNINHQQLRRNYAAEIEGIDQWVGRIIDEVDRRGELENTIIVFSSDHGEMMGDHGRFSKRVPQEGSVHVPLIAAGPGVEKGKVSNALVELIDISATLLEFSGLDIPKDWDARSFAPILRGEAEDSDHRSVQVSQMTTEKDNWKMVCDGNFKYIDYKNKENELYDLSADPLEQSNIAGSNSEIVERLAKDLQREIESTDINKPSTNN